MSFRIEHSIPDYPNDQKSDGNDAQSMAVKKRVTMSEHVEPFTSWFSTLNQAAC
jgi:hypothetical protein